MNERIHLYKSIFNLSPTFQVGFQAIAEALGLAAVKAVVAISAIIAGGRLVCLHMSKPKGFHNHGCSKIINW